MGSVLRCCITPHVSRLSPVIQSITTHGALPPTDSQLLPQFIVVQRTHPRILIGRWVDMQAQPHSTTSVTAFCSKPPPQLRAQYIPSICHVRALIIMRGNVFVNTYCISRLPPYATCQILGIMELSFPRTFAPKSESTIGGTFAPWNFPPPVPIRETYNRRSQHKRMYSSLSTNVALQSVLASRQVRLTYDVV